jgi:hypothetical protein
MAVKPTLAKYFPEDIPGARVVNLVADIPFSVESISRFSKVPGEYIVSLIAYSIAGTITVSFYANTDGTFRVIDSQGYACYNLDSVEDVFVHAKTTLALSLSSSINIANFPVRYVVRVDKPSIIEKILFGISLTDEETPINNKFELGNMLLAGEYPVRTPLLVSRKQIARTITAVAGKQQIGETITVQKNRYVVLDEIAVDGYEAGVTDNFIIVDRDLDDEYVKLNCFALPPFVYNTVAGALTPDIPLSYPFKIGIPAVDKLAIYLENGSPVANWRVRYKCSTYVLTIPDKIRWGIHLTPSEETIAKDKDMSSKVKAGLM